MGQVPQRSSMRRSAVEPPRWIGAGPAGQPFSLQLATIRLFHRGVEHEHGGFPITKEKSRSHAIASTIAFKVWLGRIAFEAFSSLGW